MARFNDLPVELLDLISDHLLALLGNDRYAQRATLKALTLTCQSFHQHFTPQLWANIEVATGSKRCQPDAVAIRNHAHWIHTLKYYGSLSQEYYDISFPNLVRVDCREWLDARRHDPEQWDLNWSRLIRLNPTIRDIHIGAGNPTDYNEIWETIVASLENPRRLAVGGTDMRAVPGPGRKAFWIACAQFEEIDFRGVDQTKSSSSSSNRDDDGFMKVLDFSRLERLNYSLLDRPRQPANLLKWIGTCSNLTRLHWGCDTGSSPGHIPLQDIDTTPVWGFVHTDISSTPGVLQDFINLAERSAWPQLDDLDLQNLPGSDEQFAALLGHLPPLKYLSLPPARGGGAAYFEPLRGRHFDSLRSLNVSAFRGFESSKALKVLQNCPQLEEYAARRVSLKDLRSSPLAWVCLGLKRLTVFFASDCDEPGPGDSTLLFDQLSRLNRLELLDVSQTWEYIIHGQVTLEKAPQWRLNSGLSQLSTLTRLQHFNVAKTGQDFNDEDIDWMLVHWPRLEKVSLCDSADKGIQNALIKKRLINL
ncbi:hypothetical protein BGX29_007875 [Mortierella sp. GBA35]|nr:hypothetical protein BGX29_007875 [Mortierella sp. GBA35]